MRKAATILLSTILCASVLAALYQYKKRDIHHYPERRAWKETAIAAIKNDLNDEANIRTRDGQPIHPQDEFLYLGNDWLTAHAILFQDGAWMLYRQQCQKADPRIHDIFIGRGSDGKWYYSDAHFCINAYVLASGEQPESIADFRKTFSLAEFDGKSDDALGRTFNVR